MVIPQKKNSPYTHRINGQQEIVWFFYENMIKKKLIGSNLEN